MSTAMYVGVCMHLQGYMHVHVSMCVHEPLDFGAQHLLLGVGPHLNVIHDTIDACNVRVSFCRETYVGAGGGGGGQAPGFG